MNPTQEQLNALETLRAVLGEELYQQKRRELLGGAPTPAPPPSPSPSLSQLTISSDAHGNIIINGNNNTLTYARDQAPAELLRLYYQALASECDRLPLGTLALQFADPKDPRALTLQNVYTDLDVQHIPLDPEKRHTPEETRTFGLRLERAAEGDDRQPLLTALAATRLSVLLGAPGSGKTTFVDYLTTRLAQQQTTDLPPELQQPRVVRLVLRQAALKIPEKAACGTAQMLWDALHADIVRLWSQPAADLILPYLQRQLAQHGGIILLDGLDEVPQAKQRRACLLQAIQDWVHSLPQARFLLTARPYAYADPQWQLPNFTTFNLAAFSQAQIENFVRHWHAAARPALGWDENLATVRRRELLTALQERSDLRALATRPLLLTLMTSLHAHKNRMPEGRAELYEGSVDLLLTRWQTNREVITADGTLLTEEGIERTLKLGEDKLRSLLQKLALHTHTQQSQSRSGKQEAQEQIPADIPLGEILRIFSPSLPNDFNPTQLIAYLEERAGLLVGRGNEIYTFPHRSFQEYPSACCLLDTEIDIAAALRQRLQTDLDWWREVFLLAIAKKHLSDKGSAVDTLNRLLPKPPQDYPKIDEFQWQFAALVAEAAAESHLAQAAPGNEAFDAVLKRLQRWLITLLETPALPPKPRLNAGDTLGRLGDPRRGVSLTHTGLPDLDWVYFPAAEFEMGSAPDDHQAWDDEKPRHRAHVPDFYLARYPVTNRQYHAFMAANGYHDPQWWSADGWRWRNGENPGIEILETWDDKVFARGYRKWLENRTTRTQPNFWQDRNWSAPNRPVVGVCWYEAQAYCNWLNAQLHAQPNLLPPGNWRVNLPSEAEWEYAARYSPLPSPSGSTPAGVLREGAGGEGRVYAWGNDWQPDYANTAATKLQQTSPVGMFPHGETPGTHLHDMTGNVWEWTRSLYQPYPYRADDGRENPGDLKMRVVRGGSWDLNNSRNVRCASRSRTFPAYFNDYLGFRMVLSLAVSGS